MRTLNIGRLLKRCGDVTFLCIHADKSPPGTTVDATRQEFARLEVIEPVKQEDASGLMARLRIVTRLAWPEALT